MSNPSGLGAVVYEAESVHGENVSTFATHRLSVVGPVDLSSIVHDKVDSERLIQYRNDGTQFIPMTMGGSFKTKLDLAGFGVTTAGSPTLAEPATFISLAIGNIALSAAASTTASAGTATAWTTAASATFTAGLLARLGALGDAKGNGQMFPVGTHVTTTLTSLVAADGAPASSDVVYPTATIYPSETPTSASVTSVRFLCLTANICYELHGCYPMAVAFSGLSTGERPQIEITWGVSWWKYSTATFPSVVTQNAYNPAPVAAGSFFINDFGTATRAKRTIRNFSLSYKLGMVALEGPGGANANQKIVGARRLPDEIELTWTEDADTATATPVLPGYGTASTYKHVMYTLSTTAGSSVGFYFPRVAITNIPVMKADGGINRLTVTARAFTSTTTTSDATLAAFKLGLG